jgi:hypothetical protein
LFDLHVLCIFYRVSTIRVISRYRGRETTDAPGRSANTHSRTGIHTF